MLIPAYTLGGFITQKIGTGSFAALKPRNKSPLNLSVDAVL
jgi:hypothetical protein